MASEASTYGAVIKEIKEMARVFQTIDFVHESRSSNISSNIDAHVLAKSSLFDAIGRHVWFLDPPYGVCNNLFNVS